MLIGATTENPSFEVIAALLSRSRACSRRETILCMWPGASSGSPAKTLGWLTLALRNAVTGMMQAEGYGTGYEYAHDSNDAVTSLDCLPDRLRGKRFYRPTNRGLEKDLAARGSA